MFWLGLFLLAFLVLNGCLHLRVRGKEGELRPDRSFGVLTLFLALFGLVGHLLSASERFLFAPDIGVMMYEGSDLQRAGLYLLLIGVVFFGALVPETARQFVQRGAEVRGKRLGLLLVLALPVSALTCFGIRVLNPADLTALQIQAYDLFFPPLVIWTGSCILLALAWCLRVPARFYPAVPVVWTVSFWLCGELRARPYDDGWTIWIWRTASLLVVGAFIAYVAQGKLAADADIGPEEMPPPDPASKAQWERRRKGAAVGLAALMLSFFVVYLLTSSALLQVKLRTLVLGYVAFWLLLAEFEDPRASVVYRFLGFAKSAWEKRSSPPPEEKPPEDAPAGGKGLLGILKWPSLGKTAAALLGALLLAFALLVVNEVPNRHKTMVMPFRDLAGHGSTELDEGIAEYVTYQLALYDQGLRQVSIPLSGPAPRRSSSGFTLGSATDPGSSFTTSNNLKVGDFEVPLQVILNPVLEPVRRFLDTRVIRGSVHVDERRYSLIATSSRGESWRVESERKPAEDSERDQETNQLKFRNEALYGKLRELAGQLAFEIYANSATSAGPSSGMTSSWEAFRSFWTGFTILRSLEESPSRGDAAQEATLRRQAIQAIEKAIAIDRSFALAGYHLALVNLSQVKTVDESKESIALLRETVDDVPEFIPAYNALAYTLVRWNGDKGEAESLLKRVLLSWSGEPVSRALAYHGLALLELDSDGLLAVAKGFQEAGDPEEGPDKQRELEDNTRAFYYARKAESLYAAVKANDPQILRRRAAVLSDLGRLLERRAGELVAVPADRWSCRGEMLLFSLPARELDEDQASPRPPGWTLMTTSGASVVVDHAALEKAFARRGLSHLDILADPKPTGRRGEAWQLETSHGSFFLLVEGRQLNVYGKVLRRGPYRHAARRFLRRAVALEPHDRTNLCQLAASNHLAGRSTAMDHLESDTKMHLAIAHRYAVHYPGSGRKIDREAVPAFFFELALEEYRALLERSPQNGDVREAACNVLSVAILRSTLGVRASRWEQAFSCPLEEVEATPAADLDFLEPSTLNERTWLELAGQAVRSARQRDFEPAEALLVPLGTLAQGYERLEAATLTVAGRIHELKGESQEAAESYEEALRRFRRLGERQGQMRANGDLVRVYATLSREAPVAEDRPGYAGLAEEHYRRVADAQGSDSRVAAAACREMAAMYEARGEKGPAEDYARRAVDAGERLENPGLLADYLDEYARILESAGKLDEAETGYQRAFEIRSYSLEPEDVRIASSFAHLGRIACLRGDDGVAASYQQRAYAMLRRFGAAHALALARAAEALGRSSLRQGRWEDAEGPLAEALEVVEEEDLGEPGLRLEHVFLVASRAALREAKEAAYDPRRRRAYRSAGARTLRDTAEESLRSLLPNLKPPLRAEAVLEDLRQATRCGRRPEDVGAVLSAYVAERQDRLRALGYEPEDGGLTGALDSFRKEASLPEVADPDAGLLDSRTDMALAELARLEGLRRSGSGDFDVLALAPASGQAEAWVRFFQKKVAEVSRSRPLEGIETEVPRVYVDLREGGVADVGSSPLRALWLVGGPETLREVFFSPEGVLECQVEEEVLRCRLEEGTRAYIPGPGGLEEALDLLEEDGMSLAGALARTGLGRDGWLAHGDARGTDPMWLIAGTEQPEG